MAHRCFALALAVAACGPTAAERRVARDALYQADRATVWQAMVDEVGATYPPDYVKVEDVERGIIETRWTFVNATNGPVSGRPMFRLWLKLEPGGPPWYVSVDGEAADLRADMSSRLQPYRRGADDEPRWVAERVARVRAGLYRRLEPYAMALPVDRP